MNRCCVAALLVSIMACGGKTTSPANSEVASHAVEEEPSRDEPMTGGTCDEVGCVLGLGSATCCAKYATVADPAREELETVMLSLSSDVQQCASGRAFGYFPVTVTVAAQGTVEEVAKPAALGTKLDATVLDCIRGVIRTQTFAPRAQPATFTYAFELEPRT